ncbi:MAG: tetratricopeptide repeat protein [Rhizobiales bacterium]|nr:tetratricopeptide repeat protein [Hyphomicrobiales bacterium]
MRARGFAAGTLVVLLALAGCAGHTDGETLSLVASDVVPEAALAEAQMQFEEGNYGLAATSFKRAVENTPKDPEAWLGLAASYDQIRRFDLADRAYSELGKLVGSNSVMLNNIGYSYLLRGDLEKSRMTLEAAWRSDPSNPTILNNITLLNTQLEAVNSAPLVVASNG